MSGRKERGRWNRFSRCVAGTYFLRASLLSRETVRHMTVKVGVVPNRVSFRTAVEFDIHVIKFVSENLPFVDYLSWDAGRTKTAI